jgi:serine/threonine-protein kinase RCK2
MRQLSHPNIVRLEEFQESKDYYFLIMELSSGGELFHQIVRLTYFSEELSRHVILQVAKGIRYLHEEKGVVHRYPIPLHISLISVTLNPKTSSSNPFPLSHPAIPNPTPPKTKTNRRKANSSPVSAAAK